MKKLISLVFMLLMSAPSWAGCSFDGGYSPAVTTITMSDWIRFGKDIPNGAELWSSGWRSSPGPAITCDTTGVVSGILPAGVGEPVPGYTNSSGFPSLFKTNIPGLGISIYWCNNTSCNPDYNNVTPLPSLAWNVQPTHYPLSSSFWIRLVKYDNITITEGALQVPGEALVKYQNLTVAKLNIVSNLTLEPITCTLNSSNITVALPSIWKRDLSAASPIVTDSSKGKEFSLDLMCDWGVRVKYKIDGPSNLVLPGALTNSEGPDMARGVGIQLLQGDLATGLPLSLGEILEGPIASFESAVKIPLAARYYRDVPAEEVVPGRISIAATFTLYYQ